VTERVGDPAAARGGRPRRRILRWVLLGLGVLVAALLVVVAIVVVPILTHDDQGTSTQEDTGEAWPTEVVALGDDGRERTLAIAAEDGGPIDPAALTVGERIVVTGSGFDGGQGIYVAICVIPDDPATKPGPCIGGVPEQDDGVIDPGSVQWAPSNWINDDWAWKLFGARSYDDPATGEFTAYLVVGDGAVDGIDCRSGQCGIVTRNDHTAAADRVQDVRIPIKLAD